MDADSISFFEEKARKKVRFMYVRMSDKAKSLVGGVQYETPKLNLIFKEETSGRVEDE